MSHLTPRQKLGQGEPLTLQELGRLAGCSTAQVRKYARTVPAQLEVYRVGRLVRVRPEEAERFLVWVGALAHGVSPRAWSVTTRTP